MTSPQIFKIIASTAKDGRGVSEADFIDVDTNGISAANSVELAKIEKKKHREPRNHPWTPEEDRILLEASRTYRTSRGITWSEVSYLLPKRDSQSCRCRWRRMQQEPGQNFCLKCGQRRRGHTCLGRLVEISAPKQFCQLLIEPSHPVDAGAVNNVCDQ